MNFFIYLLVLPVIIYIVARRVATYYKLKSNNLLLAAACLLFGVSIVLPSPQIHGENTEFMTHFFGGGIFMGLIWLYFKPLLPSRVWWHDLIWLYALTSALGVLNELYELFSFEMGLNAKPLTDTSWDLFANTLGMLVFYAGYRTIIWGKRVFFSR